MQWWGGPVGKRGFNEDLSRPGEVVEGREVSLASPMIEGTVLQLTGTACDSRLDA